MFMKLGGKKTYVKHTKTTPLLDTVVEIKLILLTNNSYT